MIGGHECYVGRYLSGDFYAPRGRGKVSVALSVEIARRSAGSCRSLSPPWRVVAMLWVMGMHSLVSPLVSFLYKIFFKSYIPESPSGNRCLTKNRVV